MNDQSQSNNRESCNHYLLGELTDDSCLIVYLVDFEMNGEKRDIVVNPETDQFFPSITMREWYLIYFVHFGLYDRLLKEFVAECEQKDIQFTVGGFTCEIDGYPFLSRIRGTYYGGIFYKEDVNGLSIECQSVLSETSNEEVIVGIQKILLLCEAAQKFNKGIFYAGC